MRTIPLQPTKAISRIRQLENGKNQPFKAMEYINSIFRNPIGPSQKPRQGPSIGYQTLLQAALFSARPSLKEYIRSPHTGDDHKLPKHPQKTSSSTQYDLPGRQPNPTYYSPQLSLPDPPTHLHVATLVWSSFNMPFPTSSSGLVVTHDGRAERGR
jgi:hypothetical protein